MIPIAELTRQILLVSWKGTRWEVAGVLREVVSAVLTHKPPPALELAVPSDAELMNRANVRLALLAAPLT